MAAYYQERRGTTMVDLGHTNLVSEPPTVDDASCCPLLDATKLEEFQRQFEFGFNRMNAMLDRLSATTDALLAGISARMGSAVAQPPSEQIPAAQIKVSAKLSEIPKSSDEHVDLGKSQPKRVVRLYLEKSVSSEPADLKATSPAAKHTNALRHRLRRKLRQRRLPQVWWDLPSRQASLTASTTRHPPKPHDFDFAVEIVALANEARSRTEAFELTWLQHDATPKIRAHPPNINAAVEILTSGITLFAVLPYDEDMGTGELRYVQMAGTTHDTSLPSLERYKKGKVQVTLVWNSNNAHSPCSVKLNALSNFLWRNGGSHNNNHLIHSIWVNFQTSRNNVIFGNHWRHLLGERDLWERVRGVDICLAPSTFGQANTTAFDSLLKKVPQYVPYGASVADIYDGSGIIGFSLAATTKCRSVKCVEVKNDSRLSFEQSLGSLPRPVNSCLNWYHADASIEPLYWLQGSDVVVVDPPRKGLHPSINAGLQNLPSSKHEASNGCSRSVLKVHEEKRLGVFSKVQKGLMEYSMLLVGLIGKFFFFGQQTDIQPMHLVGGISLAGITALQLLLAPPLAGRDVLWIANVKLTAGWGVGGIEAAAAMLGRHMSIVLPGVVGFKLSGKSPNGGEVSEVDLAASQRMKLALGKFVFSSVRSALMSNPRFDHFNFSAAVRTLRHKAYLLSATSPAATPSWTYMGIEVYEGAVYRHQGNTSGREHLFCNLTAALNTPILLESDLQQAVVSLEPITDEIFSLSNSLDLHKAKVNECEDRYQVLQSEHSSRVYQTQTSGESGAVRHKPLKNSQLDIATPAIESLHLKLEAASLDQEGIRNSYEELDHNLPSMNRRRQEAFSLIDILCRSLRELMSELLSINRDIDEVKKKCFHLAVKLEEHEKKNSHLAGMMQLAANSEAAIQLDDRVLEAKKQPLLRLAAVVVCLLQTHKAAIEQVKFSNAYLSEVTVRAELPLDHWEGHLNTLLQEEFGYLVKELDSLQEQLLHFTVSHLQMDEEIHFMHERVGTMVEALTVADLEVHAKIHELEQPEHKLVSVWEKLGIDVAKGG